MRILIAALALAATPALAQHAGHDMAPVKGAEIRGVPTGPATPNAAAAQRELAAINARMHSAMNVKVTGNLDADFVRSMIPHHQGAIEAAEVALRNSNDERIRTLARGITVSQRRELQFMRAWLKEKGIAER